jgi:hypothetical protein
MCRPERLGESLRRKVRRPTVGPGGPAGSPSNAPIVRSFLSLRSFASEPPHESMQQRVEAPLIAGRGAPKDGASSSRNMAGRIRLASVRKLLQTIEKQPDDLFLR